MYSNTNRYGPSKLVRRNDATNLNVIRVQRITRRSLSRVEYTVYRSYPAPKRRPEFYNTFSVYVYISNQNSRRNPRRRTTDNGDPLIGSPPWSRVNNYYVRWLGWRRVLNGTAAFKAAGQMERPPRRVSLSSLIKLIRKLRLFHRGSRAIRRE